MLITGASVPHTLISEREAAAYLGELSGLTRTPARRLLRTGIAGRGERDGAGRILYDRDRVAQVGGRPMIEEEQLLPYGVLRLRLSPTEPWDVETPTDEQRRRMSGPYDFAPLRSVALRILAEEQGYLPFVLTVSGFVVAGANLDPVVFEPDGRLALREPGRWYDTMRDRRWWPGRGGSALHWQQADAALRELDRATRGATAAG